MPLIKRSSYLFISVLLIASVVIFLEPPRQWYQASTFQILVFFLPLLAVFTFLINIFLNSLSRSFVLGLAGMVLVVLKAIDKINIVSVGAVVGVTALVFYFFANIHLTSSTKIPKLTLGKRRRR